VLPLQIGDLAQAVALDLRKRALDRIDAWRLAGARCADNSDPARHRL